MIPTDGSVSLILDIPCFNKDSKFWTDVFCTSWDARGALRANDMNYKTVNIVNHRRFFDLKDLISQDSELFLVSFDDDFRLTKVSNIVTRGQVSAINGLLQKRKNVGQWSNLPECKELASMLMSLNLSFRSEALVSCMKDAFRS
jgi:hypothetical protein